MKVSVANTSLTAPATPAKPGAAAGAGTGAGGGGAGSGLASVCAGPWICAEPLVAGVPLGAAEGIGASVTGRVATAAVAVTADFGCAAMESRRSLKKLPSANTTPHRNCAETIPRQSKPGWPKRWPSHSCKVMFHHNDVLTYGARALYLRKGVPAPHVNEIG